MFKKKSIYFLGIALLLLGLMWLHSGHLLHDSPEQNHMGEHNKDNHHREEVDIKFSLLGIIPTLLGVYLIDKHNRELLKK